MSSHYKALLIVMFVSVAVFRMTKPVFCRFMVEDDFVRRRNTWFAVTLTAFLAPEFWLYVVVAAIIIAYSARHDRNPSALYAILLFAVPPIQITIPALGVVNELFPLDHFRLLSIVVLAPAAYRLIISGGSAVPKSGVRVFDTLIFLYVALQVILMMPYVTITDTSRRILLYILDIFLIYYVFSRACTTPAMIREIMACIALGVLVLAPLAVFEYRMSWLLYTGIGEQWGEPIRFAWLLRGDNLRAQVSTGHSIALSYTMAIALICWLYLRSHLDSRSSSVAVLVALGTGMVVTFARGPWIGAAGGSLVFLALQPNASSALIKGAVVLAAVLGVALISPLGEYLPFIGQAGDGDATVDYRRQLMEVSWQLIKQNPFFGTPFYLDSMEELRQGQGIIDTVNTYATIALSSGAVGVGLFIAFFLGIAWKAYRTVKASAIRDRDFSLMGASLLACLVATFVVMGTTSFGTALSYMAWVLAGLTLNYARLNENAAGKQSGNEIGALSSGQPEMQSAMPLRR